MPSKIVILLTPSTFSSEGPRNYITYLQHLLAEFKFDIIVAPIKRFPIMLFDVIKTVISYPRSAFVFPYVRFQELFTIFIVFPLALISRGKIVTVVHDVHGFYFGNKLLWHMLIKLRSGLLTSMPCFRHIYVSRYSKISSLLLLRKDSISRKSYVVYPYKDIRELILYGSRKGSLHKQLLIFSKVSKMLDKEFWSILGRCLKELADNIDEVVVMGGGSNENIEKVKKIIEETWLEGERRKIVYRFNVSNRVRDMMLQLAYLVIYPPSLEGLGLPVFEAVSYAVPVLSARKGALIEFVPRTLYSERTVKYPDFCYAIAKYINNASSYIDHIKNLRNNLIKFTLNELLRFLKDN